MNVLFPTFLRIKGASVELLVEELVPELIAALNFDESSVTIELMFLVEEVTSEIEPPSKPELLLDGVLELY